MRLRFLAVALGRRRHRAKQDRDIVEQAVSPGELEERVDEDDHQPDAFDFPQRGRGGEIDRQFAQHGERIVPPDNELYNAVVSLDGTGGTWQIDYTYQLKIWRDGQLKEVSYRLPKADYSAKLIPDYVLDQEPEYLIVGGLVFQPLSNSYLRSWGEDWKRRSPFRLYYYNNEEPTKERPAVVFLSLVLADLYNLGYQDSRFLVVDKVNGRKVTRLPELREALQNPTNGCHLIEFAKGDSLQRLMIEASETETATQILEHPAHRVEHRRVAARIARAPV
jgi:hypothetical protein